MPHSLEITALPVLDLSQPDLREQFDLGAERQASPLDPQSPPRARLQGPNQWPVQLPHFKPLMLEWQQAITGMLLRLLRGFAQALSLPEHAFDPLLSTDPPQARLRRSGP